MFVSSVFKKCAAVCTTAALIFSALPALPVHPAQAASVITVGKNGTYHTVGEAVLAAAALNPSDESSRVTVSIEPGTYREQLLINTPYLTFTNSNPNAGDVVLTWYYGIGYRYYSADSKGYYSASAAASKSAKNAASRWGTAVRLQEKAKFFRAENIVFENSFNRYVTDEELADGVEPTGETITVQRRKGMDVTAKSTTERAAALCAEADCCEFLHCTFLGSQDTLYTAKKAYFKECKIQGNTDYIFGSGDVVFDACELCFGGYSDNAVGGYITAARAQNLGYLFWNCNITANPGKQVGAGYFGRPWKDTAHVLFYQAKLQYEGIIAPAGWHSMSGVEPWQATFREYHTQTASGGAVNTGSRTGGTVLNACDATREQYFGDWTPYYYSHDGSAVLTGAKLDASKHYYLKNAASGLYLCANSASGSLTLGEKDDAAVWLPETCNDGYYIFYCRNSQDSDLYALEIAGGKAENGTGIGIASGSANDAQLIKFIGSGSGSYEIRTMISGDKSCLGVSGGSKEPGAAVIEWECTGAADQQWILEEKLVPLTGTLIKELYVYDREHAGSWMIADNMANNCAVFGDRSVLIQNLPDALAGAEQIITACDSKYYKDTLASVTAAKPITLYAAMDTRVDPLPGWLSDWQQTDLTFDNNDNVTFRCYAKQLAANESAELGPNGQSSYCVNYAAFAIAAPAAETTAAAPETTATLPETTATEALPAATAPAKPQRTMRGDTDCSGVVDVSDAVLAAKFSVGDSDVLISDIGQLNADCDDSGKITTADVNWIIRKIIGLET